MRMIHDIQSSSPSSSIRPLLQRASKAASKKISPKGKVIRVVRTEARTLISTFSTTIIEFSSFRALIDAAFSLFERQIRSEFKLPFYRNDHLEACQRLKALIGSS